MTSQLECRGCIGRGCGAIGNQHLCKLCAAHNDRKRNHTFRRFALGPFNGVPSRFSTPFLPVDRASSRTGLTLRSAYFLQFAPQLSQRISVASPFGARHHISDSRVLQAPQPFCPLGGSRTTDPSSSESGAADCDVVKSSSSSPLCDARSSRIRLFSSVSFELSNDVSDTCKASKQTKPYFFQ